MNKPVYIVVNTSLSFWENNFQSSMLRIVEVPDYGQSDDACVKQAIAEAKGSDIFAHIHKATTNRNEMCRWLADHQQNAAKWFSGREAVEQYTEAIRRCCMTTPVEQQKTVDAGADLFKILETNPMTTSEKVLKAAGIAGVLLLAGCAIGVAAND